MILKLTAKGCKLLLNTQKHMNAYLAKMSRFLPKWEDDLIVLRLNLRKNIDKYHPATDHKLNYKTYKDTKAALAYFEGSMTCRLGKKQLYAHFKGHTINECITRGFDLIFRKLKQYKDLHFPSESQYPHRDSVRDRDSYLPV